MDFFSKISKHKKVISFLLLFIIIIGFVTPRVAVAASGGAYATCATAAIGNILAFVFTAGLATPLIIGTMALGCGELVLADGAVNSTLKAILLGVAELIFYVAYSVASYATKWFETFIASDFLNTRILSQEVFVTGWAQVRDLSNMFIVLGFVIVGIATALRLREYEAKKLLPILILVALMINFSGLFCGLIIDGSNMITNHFLKFSGGMGTMMVDSIYAQSTQITWEKVATNGSGTYIMERTLFSISFILLAIIFFYLVFILVARQAIFGIFFVLSPLAFVCWVFPPTKKLWNMWWENFIKWGLIGAQVSFFIWVAGNMVVDGMVVGPPVAGIVSAKIIPPTTILSVVILLYVALQVAKKSSGVGAGAVIGLATGAAGFAMGAATKVGKAGIQLSGRTALGQKTQEAYSAASARLAESTGFAPEGYAANQKSARENAAKKQVDALRTSSAKGDKSRYEQLVKKGNGAMGAAAVASANEHGDLSRILNPNNTPAGLNAMNQRVAYAQSFGHEKSEFEKKDYRLKEFNDKDTDQALTAMGHKTAINSQLTFDGINPATATAEQRVAAAKKIPTAPGLVDAELTRRGIAPATASAADRTAAETEVSVLGKARRRAILTQLKTNLPQMSGNELRNISFDHLSSAANPENYNFVRENLTPHMIDQFSTADPLKIAALQGHSHQLRRDIAAARGSGNMNEANRLRKLREAISRLP